MAYSLASTPLDYTPTPAFWRFFLEPCMTPALERLEPRIEKLKRQRQEISAIRQQAEGHKFHAPKWLHSLVAVFLPLGGHV
jgi:hypothetical protein